MNSSASPAGAVLNKIFTVTYIEYAPDSRLSLLLALPALLPVLVYATLCTLLISLRSPRPASALIGLLLSHALNGSLKPKLAAPRPIPLPTARNALNTHGMPSDHSQQAAFTAGYAAVLLARGWVDGRVQVWECVFGTCGLVGYVAVVCASRVLTRHHYVAQVCVGAGIGLISGVFWAVGESWALRIASVRKVGTSWFVRDFLHVRCAEWEDLAEIKNGKRENGKSE
jgi:membrane-associated phospholipid phosphatase